MTIQNNNPSSPIEILYDGFVYVLKIKDKRILHWSDCAGSAGRLLRIFNKEENLLLEKKINKDLLNPLVSEETINTIFKTLPTGSYFVFQNNIPEYHIVNQMMSKGEEMYMGSYYPFEDYVLIMTQPEIQINQERVEFYKQLIQKGGRPKVITFQVEFPDEYDEMPLFVLDGHHKTLAYDSLKIEIPVLNFVLNSFLKDRQDDENKLLLLELIDVLDLDAIYHIMKNNPKVYYDNNENGKKYNRYFDGMLGQCKQFYGELLRVLQKEYESNTKQSRTWVMNRLDALLISLEKNKNIWVNYKDGNEIKGCNVTNFQEFDEWVEKIIGVKYSALGK